MRSLHPDNPSLPDPPRARAHARAKSEAQDEPPGGQLPPETEEPKGASVDGICSRRSKQFISALELAERVRCGSRAMSTLLEELRAAGYVERSAAGWRLTRGAEVEFGAALRGWSPEDVDDSSKAEHRRLGRRR